MEQREPYTEEEQEETIKLRLAEALLKNVELLREKAKLLVEIDMITAEIKELKDKMSK
jgi:type II secretory pathway predicted ATPase ExeA